VLGFARLIAHAAFPAPVVFTSEGLFFAGIGAVFGAYWVAHHREGTPGRVAVVGLGLAAAGCFSVATVLPFLIGPGSLSRPSSTGQLVIVSPRAGEMFRGDPATVPVSLRLSDATIVPITTIHVVPNQGHIHLYLDGSIVAMTGLQTSLSVSPGTHTLRAEFVASDHGPFRPPVLAEVTFEVQPQEGAA
jgi:hypothetical protein